MDGGCGIRRAASSAVNLSPIEPAKEATMQGHVRKRRTWEFIVDIGPHPLTVRRGQKSKSGFATRKDAESALHEFIRYIEGGGDPSPERIGLGARGGARSSLPRRWQSVGTRDRRAMEGPSGSCEPAGQKRGAGRTRTSDQRIMRDLGRR
jgi:hypothetical protein